jgi:hypothetical protein
MRLTALVIAHVYLILVILHIYFASTAHATLPVKTNNWMSVQGNHDWKGLCKNQIHKRQLCFDKAEYGIRAGVISLITRAIRKNNKPEITLHQIFFEHDPWAEDTQAYKMHIESKNMTTTTMINLMDRNEIIPLIKFISNHEMGTENYNKLNNMDIIINKGLNKAYKYVLSDNYSLKEFIK